MSKQNTPPMFQLLLKTLQDQSEEVKAMFFADSESDLLRAFREGKEARLNKLPLSSNPYPKLPLEEMETGKYCKNLCWSEGFLITFVSEE